MALKILFAIVFEPVDAIAHHAFRPARRNGAREMELQVLTVAARKFFVEFAGKRQRAPLAEWRLDPFRLRQTCRTDDAGMFFRQRLRAELTIAREEQIQRPS